MIDLEKLGTIKCPKCKEALLAVAQHGHYDNGTPCVQVFCRWCDTPMIVGLESSVEWWINQHAVAAK